MRAYRYLLLSIFLVAPLAHAQVADGCLPTDGYDIEWSLPDEPIGPSWTMGTHAPSYSEYVPISLAFWRRPCSAVHSQVAVTLTFPANVQLMPTISLVQNGHSYTLISIALGINQIGTDGSFMVSVLRYSDPPISGLIENIGSMAGFNPDLAFRVQSQPGAFIGDAAIVDTIQVPAYDPAAYGYDGADTPAFQIDGSVSGSWYNPAQSGHGFSILVVSSNLMLIEWYVFTPGGDPMWILAMGEYQGNTATLSAYTAGGSGGRFPPAFNPSDIHRTTWGTLELTFQSCSQGEVRWNGPDGFGSGSMPITHLATALGLSCP